jgi:hypothetical protein
MGRAGGGGRTDRAWRAAVVLGVCLIACSFAVALLVPVVFGDGCPCRDQAGRRVVVLATSGDFWVAPAAARYVANGALGFVYESSRYLTALPLYPILLAPLAVVGQALGLSEPPAPMPTMWLLLAPFTVALAVPLLHQVRGLVRDADAGGAALPAQAWAAVLVAVPVLVVFGHGDDALALLGVLAAVRLAGRARWVEAGLVLGLAVASKQWALLALPALLARCAPRQRAGLAAAALALPAALALFALAVDWPHASRALLHPPNYPGYGHAAPWVHAAAATVVTAPFRLGALALAVALAGRARGGTSRLLAVLGVAFLARCAFEPVVHVYYLGPGLCLLLLHERVTTGRCTRTAVLGTLLVGWFQARPDPALWWAVAAALGVAVAYRAVREVVAGPAPASAAAGIAASSPAAGPATALASSGASGRGPATAARDSSATGSHQ